MALASDIKGYRIRNKLTFSFMLAGLGTNLILGGIKGVSEALLGILVPFVLLILLYALRLLGAGDVKLFCALGAILGYSDVLKVMVYSFIAGGVIASIILLIRKNAKERILHFINYLKYSMLTFSLQPYTDFDNKDGGKFRFAYAVASGGIIYILLGVFN